MKMHRLKGLGKTFCGVTGKFRFQERWNAQVSCAACLKLKPKAIVHHIIHVLFTTEPILTACKLDTGQANRSMITNTRWVKVTCKNCLKAKSR